MQWVRRHATWGWVVGALVFLYGLPGMIDDGAVWWGWLGSGSALTPYGVAILGVLVMVGTGIAVFTEPRRRRRLDSQREAAQLLGESRFWPDPPDYGSPPLRFTVKDKPSIIGSAVARGQRELIHRQDIEQEKRHLAERQQLAGQHESRSFEEHEAERRSAARAIQAELLAIRRAIDDAVSEKRPPRPLPGGQWERLSHLFADGTWVFGDHIYGFCRDAHIGADRINHLAEGWSDPLSEPELDELRGLREQVTSGIKVINAVVSASSGGSEPALDELDDWLFEHRKVGLETLHRIESMGSKATGSKVRTALWLLVGGHSDLLVDWVRELHHRLDCDRPGDLPRFQRANDSEALAYSDALTPEQNRARAEVFVRNVRELTKYLTERGVL